jgi:hypothetical protein
VNDYELTCLGCGMVGCADECEELDPCEHCNGMALLCGCAEPSDDGYGDAGLTAEDCR